MENNIFNEIDEDNTIKSESQKNLFDKTIISEHDSSMNDI